MIAIEGQVAFSEECAGEGWRGRAVDLTPWAARSVAIELRTNAIDGNTSYDWAVFAEPMLVTGPGGPTRPLKKDAVGLAVAEVTCAGPGTATLSIGPAQETAHLDAGTHWIPLNFSHYGSIQFRVTSGSATLTQVLAGLYDSQLEFGTVTLSSPLVTVGRPFSVLYEIKNTGLDSLTVSNGKFNGTRVQ